MVYYGEDKTHHRHTLSFSPVSCQQNHTWCSYPWPFHPSLATAFFVFFSRKTWVAFFSHGGPGTDPRRSKRRKHRCGQELPSWEWIPLHESESWHKQQHEIVIHGGILITYRTRCLLSTSSGYTWMPSETLALHKIASHKTNKKRGQTLPGKYLCFVYSET